MESGMYSSTLLGIEVWKWHLIVLLNFTDVIMNCGLGHHLVHILGMNHLSKINPQ